MDERKRKALEKLGGRVTTVAEFVGLTPAEEALVEMRLQLVDQIRARRRASGMTQETLAKAIGSSQARVAKMEGGDPQASLESLLRAVVTLGGCPTLVIRDTRSPRPDVEVVHTERSIVVRRKLSSGPKTTRVAAHPPAQATKARRSVAEA